MLRVNVLEIEDVQWKKVNQIYYYWNLSLLKHDQYRKWHESSLCLHISLISFNQKPSTQGKIKHFF